MTCSHVMIHDDVYLLKITARMVNKTLQLKKLVQLKTVLIICVIAVTLYLFNGCSLLLRPPTAPNLKKLSPRQVSAINWADDLAYSGLERAVQQSIRYYSKLPETYRFEYGELFYTPSEMILSLNLFLDIINTYDGTDRERQIQDKFIFFESRNSEGRAFFTGYYEPVIHGSLTPTDEYPEPLLRTPVDLIKVDLGEFSKKWKNEFIVGRVIGNKLVPYDSRDEIVYQKSLNQLAQPIAFVNEVELFFLQIQGSGVVKLDDGTVMRVNYAQKNGHPYRAIGRILSDRIPPEEMSLQSIKAYLNSNPDEVRDILNYNQSYVFFRTVDEGPLGDIEVPLTAGRSIAMDKRAVPRGGLAYIETELPVIDNNLITGWKPSQRFVLVQDTGGAIRDHGRVDIFMGNGEPAALSAGHLKNRGRAFLLVARKKYLQ